MNSTSLQKEFNQVYADFFSANDLVVSGCFSMSWGNEWVLHQSRYLTIGSKIPLKCYVGIRKRSDKSIVLGDIISFDTKNHATISHPYGEIMKESTKIQHSIETFLRENGVEKGVTLSILTEVPRGHSFGFSDTSSAVISAALHAFVGKTKSDLYKNYSEFLASEESEEVKKYALELSFIARNGNTIGQHILYLFSESSLPIFAYSQKSDESGNPLLVEDLFNVQQKTFPKENTQLLPLDYGVIFSGIPTSSKQIEDIREIDLKEFTKYDTFIKKDLEFQEDSMGFLGKFSNSNTIIQSYENILSFGSIQTAYFLKNIVESGINFQMIHEFIGHINNLRKIISTISQENHFAELFQQIFQQKKKLEIEEIGILPAYSTKIGGWMLFVMRQSISQETLIETMKEVQKFYPNATFDYYSHQDGEASQWLAIEQHISKNVFSPYIQKNHCIYRDNQGNSRIDLRSTLIEDESDGLLIDLVDKKIYLNGVKLTSKEIPAQNSTSEILAILFDRMNEEVPVSTFPSSSYASSKNEMLGKIVIPITRIIKEQNDIDLPFICKGSLTDFHLCLKNTSLKIGVIRSFE